MHTKVKYVHCTAKKKHDTTTTYDNNNYYFGLSAGVHACVILPLRGRKE